MRNKIKSEPINGFVYEVHQLGAIEGRALLVHLTKALAPVLGALLKNAPDKTTLADMANAEIDFEAVAQAVAGALTEAELAYITDTLAAHTEVWGPGFGDAGAPLGRNFDDHFAANYSGLVGWLVFALKVNYADFFDGKGSVTKMLSGLRSPIAPSRSPST